VARFTRHGDGFTLNMNTSPAENAVAHPVSAALAALRALASVGVRDG